LFAFLMERFVEIHDAIRRRRAQAQNHEMLLGFIDWCNLRSFHEAKSRIVTRVSDKYAARGIQFAKLTDSGPDECCSDAATLNLRVHRDRTKGIPARRRIFSARRREGDVANYSAVLLSNERNRKSVPNPKSINDVLLVTSAVRSASKGAACHGPNVGNVCRCLWPDENVDVHDSLIVARLTDWRSPAAAQDRTSGRRVQGLLDASRICMGIERRPVRRRLSKPKSKQ
jgi:hypothetical protein